MGPPNYTNPHDLPQALYYTAYTDDDPPVQNTIIGLSAVAAKMPMRSTHRSISVSPAGQGREGSGAGGLPLQRRAAPHCQDPPTCAATRSMLPSQSS